MEFRKLCLNDEVKPIRSTDKDLNSFLIDDAKNFLKENIGITYLFEDDCQTVAYCTILHDRISLKESDKKLWNKLTKQLQTTRRSSYPAIKVGRLATSEAYEGLGYGRRLINLVKMLYNREKLIAGCRFITVDAKNNPETLGFYQHLGFKFLTESDLFEETRTMAFDILSVG